MAGAGFKTFNTGDVLTSSDVNTYLMQQTVMVFDDASARSTALPTPSEGMFSYLKDTNLTYRYDGSAWISDAGTTSPLTTKGDVWGYSTADARIPVGADGTVLTADSGETLGVKWAAPAGAAANWSAVNSGGTALTGSGTVTITGISGANQILIVIVGGSSASAYSQIRIRFNADTGTNYNYAGSYIEAGATYSNGGFAKWDGIDITEIRSASLSNNAASALSGYCLVNGANSSGLKTFHLGMASNAGGGSGQQNFHLGGWYAGSSTISSVSVISETGNWDAGTVYVFSSAN